jgi:hypothetical protein
MEYRSRNMRNVHTGRFNRHRLTVIGVVAAGTLIVTAVAANAATGGQMMAAFTAKPAAYQSVFTAPTTKPTSMNASPSAMAGNAAADNPAMVDPSYKPSGNAPAGTPPVAFMTVIDPADPTFNQLLGINDSGRVAGYFGSGADAAHPNKGYQVRPDYDRDDFTNENVPGSAQTQVVGINDHGTTVGFSVDGNDANAGFVLRQNRFVSVVDPAGNASPRFDQLLGVNNEGTAAGFYNDASGASHGYLYQIQTRRFTPVILPVHADSVVASGVNDRGDISGFYTVGKVTSAFLIHNRHFTALNFGGKTNTQALGINNSNRVVGSFVDGHGNTHGFVWGNGGVEKIDDPHAKAGTVVNGINNRNQIVGFYVDAAGNTDGFLARLMRH